MDLLGSSRDLKGPQGTSRDHTFYGPSKGPRFGPQIQGPERGPRIGTKIWSLVMGPFFGPSIGTILMWSQNRDQKLVPNYGSIFWTFYRDHFNSYSVGPKCGPWIEGPQSAGGSTRVHEGPHRDHGDVLH